MRVKLLRMLKKVLLGDELVLAQAILGVISQSFGNVPPKELRRSVLQQLPIHWKAQLQTSSESDAIGMVQSGIDFYRSVRRVLMSP